MSASPSPLAEAQVPRVWGLSRNVFFLGVVSFLTDVSSEMIFTIMPLFLANVLGVGTAIIGVIEGVADSTGTLLRLASGWLSDRLGRRKALAVAGYSLSTLAKPFLYFAGSWGLVLAVRFTDRVGKGIRTAPRDALIADSTLSQERGKSFGFHRALDSLGAVLGLLGAAAIVFLLQRGDLNLAQNTFQVLVLAAIGPAVLAVLVLLWLVKEKRPQERSADPSSTVPAPAGFSLRFKIFLGVMVLFTLGNSSDAFLILRAQNLGLSVLQILLILVLFNLVYAALSGPAGVLSDRWGRKTVMIIGWTLYALIYLGFALVSSPWMVGALFVLYGLYYGASEGVARAFVADMVGAERRGTAYGLFNTAVGITALPSSVIAGWLWQAVAPSAPFYLGAALAGVAMLALWLLVKEKDVRFDNRPQVG